MIDELHSKASNGDQEALKFLSVWNEYCHEIDDLLDEKKHTAEDFIKLLILANLVYSCAFYVANADKLHIPVCMITNDYADSIKWEGDETEWRARWANTLRFAGSNMVCAVARITGGFELSRQISPMLRELNWRVQSE